MDESRAGSSGSAGPGQFPGRALVECEVVNGASAEFYLSASARDRLLREVVAVADPIGPVVLRVVPDNAWPQLRAESDDDRRLAPRAAVALDLMESGDPRNWAAAERLLADVES
jgi:hypothetical protein